MSWIHNLAAVFNAGGNFMWAILFIFAASAAVFFERVIFYFVVCRGNGGLIVSEIIRKLNAGDMEGAKEAGIREMLRHPLRQNYLSLFSNIASCGPGSPPSARAR